MNASDPDQVFLQEAQELLEQLEQTLLDLERTPGDGELIDTAFRALHTIKGSGAMFGFDAVAAFTHHVETAFDLVRKGKVTPTRELIAVALAAKDQMRRADRPPGARERHAGEAILDDLQRVMAWRRSRLPAAAAGATPSVPAMPRDGRGTAGASASGCRADAMATGTNPLLLLDELRALGPASVGAPTRWRAAARGASTRPELSVGWDVTLRTDQPRSAIEEVFLFVLDEMELEIEQITDG